MSKLMFIKRQTFGEDSNETHFQQSFQWSVQTRSLLDVSLHIFHTSWLRELTCPSQTAPESLMVDFHRCLRWCYQNACLWPWNIPPVRCKSSFVHQQRPRELPSHDRYAITLIQAGNLRLHNGLGPVLEYIYLVIRCLEHYSSSYLIGTLHPWLKVLSGYQSGRAKRFLIML